MLCVLVNMTLGLNRSENMTLISAIKALPDSSVEFRDRVTPIPRDFECETIERLQGGRAGMARHETLAIY
jgi:hypothetical protein